MRATICGKFAQKNPLNNSEQRMEWQSNFKIDPKLKCSFYFRYDLLVGVTRAESYFVFNSEDVQYGIEADRRSKILKTYVRNTYSYHLNEILATIVNEYTDWERPVQHPINIRFAVLFAFVFEVVCFVNCQGLLVSKITIFSE